MSLLNDALRKKKREEDERAHSFGLRAEKKQKRGAKRLLFLLAVVLLPISALAGVYIMRTTSDNRSSITLTDPVRMHRPLSRPGESSSTGSKRDEEGSVRPGEEKNPFSPAKPDIVKAVDTSEKISGLKTNQTASPLYAAIPSNERSDHAVDRLEATETRAQDLRKRRKATSHGTDTSGKQPQPSFSAVADSGWEDSLKENIMPAEESPFYKKALVHHRSGRLSDAVRFYRKVLEFNSNHEGAMLNLAAAYIELGNFHQAGAFLEQLESLPSRPRGVLLNLAIASIGAGEAENAVQYLKRAQNESDASILDIQFHRAVAYSQLDRLPEAMTLYQQILDERPDDTSARFNLAVTCDSLGFYPKALTHYQAVLQSPSDIDIYPIQRRIQTIGKYLNANRNAIARP